MQLRSVILPFCLALAAYGNTALDDTEVVDYKLDNALSATKTNTATKDIPASIQLIDGALFKDQGVVYLNDAFKYINGVNAFSEYLDFNMRGFRQREDSVKYNGLSQSRYGFFHKAKLNNVERIEVIKGPASSLYGISQPGGIINIITKQPKAESEGEISINLGGYNFSEKGVYLSSTGSFDNNDNLLYLIQSSLSASEGFRKNEKFNSKFFAGGLTYLIDEQKQITFNGEYLRDHTLGQRNRGIPFIPKTGKLAEVSKDYTANEPSDFISIETYSYQMLYQQQFNDDMKLSTTLGFNTNDRRQRYHEPRGLLDDGRTMKREFRHQIRKQDEWVFNTDFNYILDQGFMSHNILVGAEYYMQDFEYWYFKMSDATKGGPVKNIDIFDPVYEEENAPHWMKYYEKAVLYRGRPQKTRRVTGAVYLQDQIKLGDMNILAGLRYNSFEDKDKAADPVLSYSDSKTTFKVGSTYEVFDGQTVYGSYAQGFFPTKPLINFFPERHGGPFKPEKSYSIDTGLKSDFLDNRLSSTIAFYHIIKEDVLVRSPSEKMPLRYAQLGEVTSQDLRSIWSGE